MPSLSQVFRLERHKINIRVHRNSNLLSGLTLLDIFDYLIIRKQDMRGKQICLILIVFPVRSNKLVS